MSRQLRIVFLGDTHWGAVPAARLEAELNETFIPYLLANEFDAVVQLGDWYDKRLSLESEDAKAAMRMTVLIAQICQHRSAKFTMIRGTISHDGQQQDNYTSLESEFPGVFRLITTATAEEFFPGFFVAWMPEEYPENYRDFYDSRLFVDQASGAPIGYDAIFGHGEIDVAAGWSTASESERHYGGTPCHSADELLAHCFGPVEFGHVHVRFRYRGRLGYPGSFTRWVQGEEQTKGFDVLDLTMADGSDTWETVATQIPNTGAMLYKTVTADEIWNLTMPVDEMVKAVRAAAESVDRLRVKIGTFPIGVAEMSLVRSALVEERKVSFFAVAQVSRSCEPEQEVALEATVDGAPLPVKETRFGFLRDQAVPVHERLLRFIHTTNSDPGITIDDVLAATAPLVN